MVVFSNIKLTCHHVKVKSCEIKWHIHSTICGFIETTGLLLCGWVSSLLDLYKMKNTNTNTILVLGIKLNQHKQFFYMFSV